jgi:hypothetical protein
VGVKVKLIKMQGAGHGLPEPGSPLAAQLRRQVREFFDEQLKGGA